jgi:predicted  nucleic acid-binding Zn-ribbon protein
MKTLTQLFALTLLVSGLSLHAMDDTAQLKALEDELQQLNAQQSALRKEFADLVNFLGPDDFDERPPEPRLAQLWQKISNMQNEQETLQAQIKQKQEAMKEKK